MAYKTTKIQKGIWLSIAVLFGFLVAWEWSPVLFEIPPYIIPSASSVFIEFIHSIGNERLFYHTGFTVYPKILVAVLIVFPPIMVNVLGAIRTVDPDMINLARTFNATRWQIFKMIEFRDAMPPLFSGLRIGSTLAIIGVAVVEMVGGSEGLGAVLVSGGGSGNTALVFVAIVMMTLVGILAYVGVVFIEKRVLHYMPRKELNAI